MSPRDIALTILLVAIWGTNFVALKWSLAEIPPFLLTALRYILCSLPAIFFVPRPKVSMRFLILYGTVVGTLQFGFIFVALEMGMPAGLASLVMQTQAFFTIALAVWLLRERPGLPTVLGAVVALAGIGVIAVERIEGAALLPLLLTLAAAFCWGASNIITKKAGPDVDMLGLVIWGALVPPIPMLAMSFLFEGGFGVFGEVAAVLTLRGGLSLLFSAYLSTLVAYGIWATLLGKYPANLVAPFTLLVPIFGIGSTVLVLGETISGIEIVGSVLVFVGLMLNVFGPRVLARWRAA